MSFWPRLRKRSKGRRRSSGAKPNPYAARDNDKYAAVHAQLEAERSKFAAEHGVPVSVVRFVSRSSRGWVSLPSECHSLPVPSPEIVHSSRNVHGLEVKNTGLSEISQEFSFPCPALPLPTATADDGARCAEEVTRCRSGNFGLNLELKASSSGRCRTSGKNSGRLGRSRALQNKACKQLRKTAAVVFVKVLVVSRALDANRAIALTIAVVVDTWNRGKSTFQRVFSAVAAQLLTTVQPHLSLQKQSLSVPVILAAKPSQLSFESEMRVIPVTEITYDPSQDLRLASSFSSPAVFTEDSSKPSPVSANEQPHAFSTETLLPEVAPLVESNKSSPRRYQKFKLFKCQATKKGNDAVNAMSENLISGPEDAESIEASSGSGSSAPSSPARGKSKNMSFIRRKSNKGGDGEFEELERPSSSPVTIAKNFMSRSHESLLSRSPNNNEGKESSSPSRSSVVAPVRGKNVSRSQELRFGLKSLRRKKSTLSHEFASSLPPSIEELALPKSTVEGLQALAFPFNEDSSRASSPRGSPIPGSSPPKRDGPVCRRICSKSVECSAPVPPSKGAGSTTNSSKSTGSTTANCGDEITSGLRRSKTEVPHGSTSEPQVGQLRKLKTPGSIRSVPPQSQLGELGRSELLSREVLGSLLLFAILAFLRLGRLPAILATACLCLVLSCAQNFAMRNMTRRDRDLLRRSSGLSRGAINGGRPGSLSWGGKGNGHGSNDKLQSSEYRKRVLIEGFLDRGNRRGSTP